MQSSPRQIPASTRGLRPSSSTRLRPRRQNKKHPDGPARPPPPPRARCETAQSCASACRYKDLNPFVAPLQAWNIQRSTLPTLRTQHRLRKRYGHEFSRSGSPRHQSAKRNASIYPRSLIRLQSATWNVAASKENATTAPEMKSNMYTMERYEVSHGFA